MDGRTFVGQFRDDHETELSRLGSSKSLYALTGGEMDAPNVRAAAHDEAVTAARLFEEWSDSGDDSDAVSVFRDVAEAESNHADVVGSAEGNPDTTRQMYETLEGFTDTPARLGALVARTVIARRTAEQMVGFFVGDADPSTADTFRGIRDDYDDQLDSVAAALDDACETDEHWNQAEAAADAVVEAAYGNYVDTLESMGVQPKNVC